MTTTVLSPRQANDALTSHRHYAYRGCAADPDQPTQAAGNPDLPLDAFVASTADGGVPREERLVLEAAAREVCIECPVMVQCLAVGSALTPDGKLAEPYGIRGGLTSLERHKAHIARRKQDAAPTPAAAADFDTPQKRAVLTALAAHTHPDAVARAAGLDLRTTNWQRSKLATMLGLDKKATRTELLDAAADLGLIHATAIVPDDGTIPAVPPPAPSPAALARRTPTSPTPALVLISAPTLRSTTGSRKRRQARRPQRSTDFGEQLALAFELADTHQLLEAAA